jgi:hypothetical protein
MQEENNSPDNLLSPANNNSEGGRFMGLIIIMVLLLLFNFIYKNPQLIGKFMADSIKKKYAPKKCTINRKLTPRQKQIARLPFLQPQPLKHAYVHGIRRIVSR